MIPTFENKFLKIIFLYDLRKVKVNKDTSCEYVVL